MDNYWDKWIGSPRGHRIHHSVLSQEVEAHTEHPLHSANRPFIIQKATSEMKTIKNKELHQYFEGYGIEGRWIDTLIFLVSWGDIGFHSK